MDNKMSMTINGKPYYNYSNLEVSLVYDGLASTFSFTTNIDGTQEQKDALAPLKYQVVRIYVGPTNAFLTAEQTPHKQRMNDSNLLVTGNIIAVSTVSKAKPNTIEVKGRALTGVLGECEVVAAIASLKESPWAKITRKAKEFIGIGLEDIGLTLEAICLKAITPFGVELHVNEFVRKEAETVIPKAVADDGQIVSSYLTSVASQLNVIVSNTRYGRLLLTRLRSDEAPVSKFIESEGQNFEISMNTDGSKIFSSYTVVAQNSFDSIFTIDEENDEATVYAPMITKFRPKIKQQTVTGATAEAAAINTRARSLADCVTFSIKTKNIRYDSGLVMKPNRVVILKAPSLWINKEISIFVRDVQLREGPNGSEATLECCMLEAFSNQDPKYPFS